MNKKKVARPPIGNMVESTLTDIVEQRSLDTILIRSVDKLSNFPRFMNVLTRRAVRIKSAATLITALVKIQVRKVTQKVRFERKLEFELTKRGMRQYNPRRSHLHSPEFAPRVRTRLEQSMSSDSGDEKTH